MISLYTLNTGSDIVLASYSAGTKECWAIEDNTASGASVFGGTGVGTTYAVWRTGESATTCKGNQATPTAIGTTGFPAA